MDFRSMDYNVIWNINASNVVMCNFFLEKIFNSNVAVTHALVNSLLQFVQRPINQSKKPPNQEAILVPRDLQRT